MNEIAYLLACVQLDNELQETTEGLSISYVKSVIAHTYIIALLDYRRWKIFAITILYGMNLYFKTILALLKNVYRPPYVEVTLSGPNL